MLGIIIAVSVGWALPTIFGFLWATSFRSRGASQCKSDRSSNQTHHLRDFVEFLRFFLLNNQRGTARIPYNPK
ncbi:hypothetical protein NIES2098_30400 [Calothrix sp. NIES-2098]|nr:hypothetical protein NIES2098_30400 [Calothrix sp. NIES-2098]